MQLGCLRRNFLFKYTFFILYHVHDIFVMFYEEDLPHRVQHFFEIRHRTEIISKANYENLNNEQEE